MLEKGAGHRARKQRHAALVPPEQGKRIPATGALGEWGIPKDSPAGRQRLEQALEARRGAEEDEEFKLIRRGWCLGEETFRRELLAQMSERMGEERAQTAEAIAEQIIAVELKRRRWKEAELRTRPRGDAEKVALAARLRAKTTMTVGWIAERLGMEAGAI